VGGQSALNLRKVCSTTKNWIDDLPEPQANRIFAESTATVELHGPQTLNLFLKHPPPSPVTSLKISVIHSGYVENLQEGLLHELWNRFVDYWWLKLESLQLTKLDSPKSKMLRLLSCPTLRRVQLDCVKCMLSKSGIHSWEALQPLSRLEHISVNSSDLNDVELRNFIRLLSAYPTIKSVKLLDLIVEPVEPVKPYVGRGGRTRQTARKSCGGRWEPPHLREALTALIQSKEEDADFKLTLGIAKKNYETWENWLSFMSAVEASKSSIRILQMSGVRFQQLFNDQDLDESPPETLNPFFEQELEEYPRETCSTFFSNIESIVGLSPASLIDGSLLQVPSLRHLEIVKYPGEKLKSGILDPEYPYPKPGPCSLYKKGLRCLPKGLESVTFTRASCSVGYLKDLLIKLDQQCPSLKELCLEWTCTDSSIEMPYWCRENGANSSLQDLNSCTPFKSMNFD